MVCDTWHVGYRGFNPSNPVTRRFLEACRDAADIVEVTLRPDARWTDYKISTVSGVSLDTTVLQEATVFASGDQQSQS